MSLELSKEQLAILQETSAVETPAEFQALLAEAKPRMDKIVKQVQEPNQPVNITLTELRDLALSLEQHASELDKMGYDPSRRTLFKNAIRLLATGQVWFGDGVRTGAYRTLSVEEVVEASRPWRRRLKAYGDHAFAFDPEIAEQLGDVNTTGTLDEEISDLGTLNKLVAQHRPELSAVGVSEEFVQQGISLHEQANGRDLAGIIGVRNKTEATDLRNRILTYATLLAGEARGAGVNACYDDDKARTRFEAASFRNAMRVLRPRRGKSPTKETAGDLSGAPAVADPGPKVAPEPPK